MSSMISPAQKSPVEATPRVRVTPYRRRIVYAYAEGRCMKCREMLFAAVWELDHILPLELGGKDEIHNLQALCIPCHKIKTREDRKRIAKAARLRRDADPETRRRSPHKIRSRGFQKDPLRNA